MAVQSNNMRITRPEFFRVGQLLDELLGLYGEPLKPLPIAHQPTTHGNCLIHQGRFNRVDFRLI